MDRQEIERYAAGAAILGQSIVGLSREDLLALPVPGTWSIQQIVVHMMDSDLIGADRMKRVIAEERPQFLAYNESAFATRLGYEHADAAKACEVFRLNRELTADLLRRLPDEDFERIGDHSENGPETLAYLVAAYADHLDGHMQHLLRKRELLGKPL